VSPSDCDNDRQPEIAIWTLWAPTLQFLVVNRCRDHLANLLSSSSSLKIPNLALEVRRYLSEFQRCNYFQFWGHIDISGCRSPLYLLANTIFHLYMVLKPRFVVGILTVPHIVSEILVLPVSWLPSWIFDMRYRSVCHDCWRFKYFVHSHKPLYCFGTTCVSVKPAKLLVLPVIWLPSWISSTHRRPTKSEVPLPKFQPLHLCFRGQAFYYKAWPRKQFVDFARRSTISCRGKTQPDLDKYTVAPITITNKYQRHSSSNLSRRSFSLKLFFKRLLT